MLYLHMEHGNETKVTKIRPRLVLQLIMTILQSKPVHIVF